MGATATTDSLLGRLRSFGFPMGEAAARVIRGVTTTETGHLQMSAGARVIPFSADQLIDATCSRFSWQARLDPGKITSVTVTDAYENAHGHVSVKVAGPLPAKKISGPDADKGELQRYLASFALCPTMLLNYASLEFQAVGTLTLRVSDRNDPAHSTVDLELSEGGCPLRGYAERPRLVGKQSILTPWLVSASDFRMWESVRIPFQLEAAWQLEEGLFTYYRAQVKSVRALG